MKSVKWTDFENSHQIHTE